MTTRQASEAQVAGVLATPTKGVKAVTAGETTARECCWSAAPEKGRCGAKLARLALRRKGSAASVRPT